MEKPEYKSKTVWASVILALAVIYKIITQGYVSAEDVMGLATALGLYGLRKAIGNLE